VPVSAETAPLEAKTMTNFQPLIAVTQGELIFWLVALGLLLALAIVYRGKLIAWGGRAKIFLGEVVAELRKSTWPTWIELRDSTIVVIIAVIALAIFVGIADWVFSNIIGLLTKRG
jgi:preprotein translocase subunit SecE